MLLKILPEKTPLRRASACGDEELGKVKAEDRLEDIFKPGTRFKIEEKSGQLWTATIARVDGEFIHFTDKNGIEAGVHKDNIKGYHRMKPEGEDG